MTDKKKPQNKAKGAKAKVLQGKDSFVISPIALSDGKLLVRDQHELKCLDVRAKGDSRVRIGGPHHRIGMERVGGPAKPTNAVTRTAGNRHLPVRPGSP